MPDLAWYQQRIFGCRTQHGADTNSATYSIVSYRFWESRLECDGPRSTRQYVGAYAGRCRFRKVRARLMVRAFSSGGSFQGNTVISAFGASEAMSIETWSGCAVTSSGSTSIGVWHDFAKSRDTLYTKSGCAR